MIIAIVNEVFVQKMIEKAIQEQQRDCLVFSQEDNLQAAFQDETPEALFIDIGVSTIDGPFLIYKLKQSLATRTIPIVAFGNSLRADLLQDAKEAGADLVLPKSAFSRQLPELIRHYKKTVKK